MSKSLEVHIEEMRNVCEHLYPYSYPNVSSLDAKDVDCLKQRTMYIDGYRIGLHFDRMDFGTHYIEKIEIVGLYAPFLPMCLLCKIAVNFLGGYGLRLSEQFYSSRKLYTWDIKIDKTGKPMRPEDEELLEQRKYGELEYIYSNWK